MEIKFLKIKKSFKKGNSELNAVRYWKIILFFASVLISAAFVFSFYHFNEVNKDSVIPEIESSDQLKIVKKERIGKVVEYFSVRESRSVDIINSPSSAIDPSR